MDAIRKDIFVTRADLPVVIKCTQDTNALPWVFGYADYNIPDGAEARIFIKKPSGLEVYSDAAISGNEVTVTVTGQMVIEAGRSRAQLQILREAVILNSFVFFVDVQKGVISETAVESSNEYTVLDALIQDARKATEAANRSAEQAIEAAERAETAGDEKFINIVEKAAPEGVATLGEDGKVPAGQLPELTAGDLDAYTKEETDSAISDAIGEAIGAATSRRWTVSVAPADWATASDSWSGISTSYKATKDCADMTADTDITGIVFVSGDREAAAAWAFLRPGAGHVEICSETKPGAAFVLELLEVR